MTINFKVGDDIWWLDTITHSSKSRIRYSTILDIVLETSGGYGYIISYDNKCIWSPNTVIAKSKKELIDILCPAKIGPFEYDQLVYIVKNVGDYNSSLQVDKAYIKGPSIFASEYSAASDINDPLSMFTINIKDIYSTLDLAKQSIETWLNSNVK